MTEVTVDWPAPEFSQQLGTSLWKKFDGREVTVAGFSTNSLQYSSLVMLPRTCTAPFLSFCVAEIRKEIFRDLAASTMFLMLSMPRDSLLHTGIRRHLVCGVPLLVHVLSMMIPLRCSNARDLASYVKESDLQHWGSDTLFSRAVPWRPLACVNP